MIPTIYSWNRVFCWVKSSTFVSGCFVYFSLNPMVLLSFGKDSEESECRKRAPVLSNQGGWVWNMQVWARMSSSKRDSREWTSPGRYIGGWIAGGKKRCDYLPPDLQGAVACIHKNTLYNDGPSSIRNRSQPESDVAIQQKATGINNSGSGRGWPRCLGRSSWYCSIVI